MSVKRSASRTPSPDDGQDDLQRFLGEVEAVDPELREMRQDLASIHEVLDQLVRLRQELGLSQTDVADRMGVRQPTVSQFENESSDPKLSTLQRYARALGWRIETRLRPSSEHEQLSIASAGLYQMALHAARVWHQTDIVWPLGEVERMVIPFSPEHHFGAPGKVAIQGARVLAASSAESVDWRATRSEFVKAS